MITIERISAQNLLTTGSSFFVLTVVFNVVVFFTTDGKGLARIHAH